MNNRKTMLVALDFGPTSEAVLNETIALTHALEATLHLIHVFPLPDSQMSRSTYTYFATSKQAQLAAAGARCRAPRRLGSLLLHEGDPASQILLAADAIRADMIVMGASARDLATRLRLEGVVEAVIRRAVCTVMVVRAKAGIHHQN